MKRLPLGQNWVSVIITTGTSGQDGDVGRHTLLPCTTNRKTTTNLKTKNNQICQKIELYGSQTTKNVKEETFIQTWRWCGDGQPGWRDTWQGGSWGGLGWVRQWLAEQTVPRLCADKPGGTTGQQHR